MPGEDYTYGVARIRAKELTLLSAQDLEQLLSARDYAECFRLLEEKGWESPEDQSAEQLLSHEREKLWSLMGELVKDLSVFDVFLYLNDYHNLKAAIKLVYTDAAENYQGAKVFLTNATVDPELILQAAREQEFGLLPEPMSAAGREAWETLLHTGDGQLCDVILDRAALEAVYRAGKESKDSLIRDYAELTVAAADLKIAARAQKTGKSLEFLQRALANCDTLNAGMLAHAAAQGLDAICDYLATTSYSGAVESLRESASAFERWCDNALMEKIRPQKCNSFTLGPLAAYVLARENEMKCVRIILSGKLNQLPQEVIRERLRETYV